MMKFVKGRVYFKYLIDSCVLYGSCKATPLCRKPDLDHS